MKADEKRKDSPKLHMNYASRRKDAIAVTVEFERARASRSRSALGAARRDARRDAARLAISAGRRVARHERVQLPEGSVVSQGPISGPCGPRNPLEAGEGGAGARVAESESRLGCQRSAWGWSRRQPASVGASPRLPIAPRAAERGGARLGSYSFKLCSPKSSAS